MTSPAEARKVVFSSTDTGWSGNKATQSGDYPRGAGGLSAEEDQSGEGGTHAGLRNLMKWGLFTIVLGAGALGATYFAQDISARPSRMSDDLMPVTAWTQHQAAFSTASADQTAGFAERDLDPSTYAYIAELTVPEGVMEARNRAPQEQVVTVRRGDTLMKLLVDAGIERGEAFQAIEGLSTVFDPRHLRAGQDITLTFLPPASVKLPLETEMEHKASLLGLSLQPSVEREVSVRRGDDGVFAAEEIEHEFDAVTVLRSGRIKSSLYEAAVDAGVPIAVLWEMVRTFSYDVDFQRDIQPGDRFEILFEELRNDAGDVVNTGAVRYAAMVIGGKSMPLYRFEPRTGEFDFFDPRGHSVKKALLRTPVDGARLSSGFGMRHHPVLGYSRMHRGVDFAAATGTPIMAAGAGTVARAGWFGAYGKYVQIRHNNEFATAYAHMSRIAPNLQPGSRIQQGQIIGYIGSTGRSTGPHLHYEILKGGEQVNPLNVKFPTGEVLAGKLLAKFEQDRLRTDRLITDLRRDLLLAANGE